MTKLKNLRVKIKITLPAAFFMLIFFVATMLISLNQINYAGSMRRLSSDIMKEISTQVANELQMLQKHSHYQLKQTTLLLAQQTFEEMLANEDDNHLSPVLVNMFEENRVVTQLYFGTVDGDFYLIHRDSSGYALKVKNQDLSFSNSLHFDSTGAFLYNEKGNDYAEYDPRKREWYSGSLNEDAIYSGSVYRFYRTGQMGFTYARAVQRDTVLLGVAGMDISVDSLSSYISNITISEGGFIFLVDKNQQGIAHSIQGGLTESGDSLIHEPSRILFTNYLKNGADQKRITFTHDRVKYLALLTRFPSGATMGIAIPSREILGDVHKTNIALIFFSIAGVLIASLAGLYLSNRVTAPLAELQRETEEIRNFKLDTNRRISSRFQEIDQIGESFQRMQRGLSSFRKFVPGDLVRQIMSSGTEAALGGEDRRMTVMFMDIAGFTTLAEQLNSDALVRFISDFFQEMSLIIIEYGGTVDKYIGDCIMAFWNAPKTVDNHEELACEAALACQERLEELQREWRANGLPEIAIRVGIHTDDVTVGNMGSKERLNYTVIGDGVNLASRLEGLGKIYGVPLIISETVAGRLPENYHLRPLDCVVVKGKSAPVPIYTINREQCESIADLHRCGYDHYVRQEWHEAQESFNTILERDNNDTPAVLFLARIASLKNTPPGCDWDGVFHLNSK